MIVEVGCWWFHCGDEMSRSTMGKGGLGRRGEGGKRRCKLAVLVDAECGLAGKGWGENECSYREKQSINSWQEVPKWECCCHKPEEMKQWEQRP